MKTPQELDDAYWERKALERQYDGPIPLNAVACPAVLAGVKRDYNVAATAAGVALATQILNQLKGTPT